MIWNIVKKEILDILISLRFPLALILMSLLMCVIGIIFREQYKDWSLEYSKGISESYDKLASGCEGGVGYLFIYGPGKLYARPSPLGFCGSDEGYPKVISAGGSVTEVSDIAGGGSYRWKWPWWMNYDGPSFSRALKGYPRIPPMDWGFIIGVLGGLIGGLFVYDSISEERNSGTLRLMLSNPISRSSVLVGKILGGMIGFLMAVMPGMIFCILLNSTILSFSDLVRLLLIFALSLLYFLVIVCSGIVVSSITSNPSNSLTLLLLIWSIWAFILPQATSFIMSEVIGEPGQPRKISYQNIVMNKWNKRLRDRAGNLKEDPTRNIETMRQWGEFMREFAYALQRDRDKDLEERVKQAEKARMWIRLSPSLIYRYAVEGISGTGLSGYKDFVEQARNYREEFLDFLKRADMDDPESPHVFWVIEGMSKREVSFDLLPKFEYKRRLSYGIREAMMDIGILAALGVLMFLLSYLAFMRADVR